MNNIKITLQYDGTRYKGWQKQNQKGSTVVTVQGKIEAVLTKMTGEEVEVTGCGRTDSGVHAENYVAHFLTNSQMTTSQMEAYLLEYLPEDIVVKEVKKASENFHARYNVIAKTYVYKIINSKFNDVFLKKYSYQVEKQLNIQEMRKAAAYLVGSHDFKSFTNLKSKKKRSTVKKINYINITKDENLVQIEVNGDGFLLNMVRIISGTLIEVGLGERKADDIKEILEALDRDKSGLKVPGKGLTLKSLEY